MTKILFLAANPKNTNALRLDEEVRSIEETLRLSGLLDGFQCEREWAVRMADLPGHLLRHQPHIVHFSGHGSPDGEIILEDNAGQSKPASPAALKWLFATLKDNIRCVVLNACYSEAQAAGIAESIDCVVGMTRAIGDESAIAFAASFYQALGYGRSVQTAFDLGCGQIGLEGLGQAETPKLRTSTGVNAADVFLTPGETASSSRGGSAATADSEERPQFEENLKVGLRARYAASSVRPFGTGEPLHLEIDLTVVNLGSTPVFIVDAALKDPTERRALHFTDVCSETESLKPGGRRKGKLKLLHHSPFPEHPRRLRTPEQLFEYNRFAYKLIRFACQPDSAFHIETGRGTHLVYPATQVCDENFLGWPFLATPMDIQEAMGSKSLKDFEDEERAAFGIRAEEPKDD